MWKGMDVSSGFVHWEGGMSGLYFVRRLLMVVHDLGLMRRQILRSSTALVVPVAIVLVTMFGGKIVWEVKLSRIMFPIGNKSTC